MKGEFLCGSLLVGVETDPTMRIDIFQVSFAVIINFSITRELVLMVLDSCIPVSIVELKKNVTTGKYVLMISYYYIK